MKFCVFSFKMCLIDIFYQTIKISTFIGYYKWQKLQEAIKLYISKPSTLLTFLQITSEECSHSSRSIPSPILSFNITSVFSRSNSYHLFLCSSYREAYRVYFLFMSPFGYTHLPRRNPVCFQHFGAVHCDEIENIWYAC